MPVNAPAIHKLPLASNQYYQAAYTKKYIFLHHTAGGSAASSIGGWAATPEHIATPYLIDRNGDIFECYDPKYWAYSLGVKGNSNIEKAAIPIEICCYGALKKQGNDWVTYTNKKIEPDKICILPQPFRPSPPYDGLHWEAYTSQQIASLAQLLPYLIDRFKLQLQPDRKNFWEYRNPSALPPGIYSHTTVRKDKIDIFPQPALVDLVYHL